MSIHTNIDSNTATAISGINFDEAKALVDSGAITEGDLEHALEADREYTLLCIAHPEEEDRELHRADQCDGSCLRFRCFR